MTDVRGTSAVDGACKDANKHRLSHLILLPSGLAQRLAWLLMSHPQSQLPRSAFANKIQLSLSINSKRRTYKRMNRSQADEVVLPRELLEKCSGSSVDMLLSGPLIHPALCCPSINSGPHDITRRGTQLVTERRCPESSVSIRDMVEQGLYTYSVAGGGRPVQYQRTSFMPALKEHTAS